MDSQTESYIRGLADEALSYEGKVEAARASGDAPAVDRYERRLDEVGAEAVRAAEQGVTPETPTAGAEPETALAEKALERAVKRTRKARPGRRESTEAGDGAGPETTEARPKGRRRG